MNNLNNGSYNLHYYKANRMGVLMAPSDSLYT